MLAWAIGLLAAAGIGFMLHSAFSLRRLFKAPAPLGPAEPVSLLKPLHGAEPRLRENLQSFLDQAWAAPIQLVAGVQRPDDPAAGIARSLPVALVVDATAHGANAKVSNLINMAPAARHDLIVLSDSDMAVSPHYLATLAGALAQPGVGAVSCLYRGRGDAGGWSRFAAAMLSYQFLPAVGLGLHLGLAQPCMGSTIALRRATLDSIGGFARFADLLADDYAIGEAIRAEGLRVAVPPLLTVHACDETSLAAIWRHEVRWAATVRLIDPAGFAGMTALHPLPAALLLTLIAPLPGLALVVAAIGARLVLKRVVDRIAGASTAPAWMLPARDLLSFAVHCRAFTVRSVDWRGRSLRMAESGRVTAGPESRRS